MAHDLLEVQESLGALWSLLVVPFSGATLGFFASETLARPLLPAWQGDLAATGLAVAGLVLGGMLAALVSSSATQAEPEHRRPRASWLMAANAGAVAIVLALVATPRQSANGRVLAIAAAVILTSVIAATTTRRRDARLGANEG